MVQRTELRYGVERGDAYRDYKLHFGFKIDVEQFKTGLDIV